MTWRPIPSTIPVVTDTEAVLDLRQQLAPAGQAIIGCFSTFGTVLVPGLRTVLSAVLRGHSDRVGLLLGCGAGGFAAALVRTWPELAPQLVAADDLTAANVSRHLQACDLLVQPYPDGVSTRRTTVMAALAHGRPVVTNLGRLSEPFWAASGAVATAAGLETVAATAETVLTDAALRAQLGHAARALYDQRFAIEHTVAALLRYRPDCYNNML
jgi:glycosyltransferase involved in cell wall biosynthesis